MRQKQVGQDHTVTRVCGVCGVYAPGSFPACQSCGSASFLGVSGDAIVGLPTGFPCMGCGMDDLPLVFRAWVKHTGYLIGSSEQRSSGYVCARCANRRGAAALAWTGILGWWSISSFLFRAPIATFNNWVAAFRAPIRPLAWGAVPVAEYFERINAQDEDDADEARPDGFDQSPFSRLNQRQASVVLAASGLYEILQVSPLASQAELRVAYTTGAKAVHPDLNPDGDGNDRMLRLNQAWEILRDEQMRAAYDWLEANR